MNSQTLEKAALVGLGMVSGLVITAKVPGPVGWLGGPSLIVASEYYRRKERLNLGEVSLAMAQFTWNNTVAAAGAVSGEVEAISPVYANVVQQARTVVDHGVQRSEVDLDAWVRDTVHLRSLIIAGLPGEGKTHTAKALILAILRAFPKRYLKICTLDRGLSHDDTKPETWLGLGDEWFSETIDDIRQELEAAEQEMEDRYQRGKSGQEVDKYPYIVFVDELVATIGMLKTGANKQYAEEFDRLLNNLLVRGPKARVWVMGAAQMLDCKGTGMNQAVLKLFEFIVMPQMGASSTTWRNLPDTPQQQYIITEMQGAPQKAPKPVAVLRAGKGVVMTMPRLDVPDTLEVVNPADEIGQWVESQAEVMADAIEQGHSPSKAWELVELPQGVKRSKAKDNEHWQRFRAKYEAMKNGD